MARGKIVKDQGWKAAYENLQDEDEEDDFIDFDESYDDEDDK